MRPAESRPPVEADGLALSYGSRPVLRDVTLSFERGNGAVALVGRNGSGKSTFLKACLGLLKPRAGDLRVLGARAGTGELGRTLKRVGWVPQQRSPGSLRISVRDLVEMGRYARAGVGKKLTPEDRDAAERAMETAGVLDLADRVAQELSGGQQQRANIARALAGEPELLLLDEPTTHLDRESRGAVSALIEDLARDDAMALAIVSHDPGIIALCGSFYDFSEGTARRVGREELDVDD